MAKTRKAQKAHKPQTPPSFKSDARRDEAIAELQSRVEKLESAAKKK